MKLPANLKRLTARYRLRVFLRRLTASAAGTFAAAGLYLVSAALLGLPGQPPVIAGAAACAALLLAAASLLVAPAGPAAASRFIEAADPALHSKLSTALELEQRGDTAGPVRQAQLRDAAREASGLIPRERVPLTPPRTLLLSLGGAAALLGAASVLQPAGSPAVLPDSTGSTMADTRLSGEERTGIAENLQELATLFSGLDEEEENPYLRAISRQLEELGRRVADDGATREETAAELERLLQHTRTVRDIQEAPEAKERLQELPDFLETALKDLLEPAETLAETDPDAGGPESGAAAEAEGSPSPDGAETALQEPLAEGSDDGNSASATAAGDQGEGGSYYEMMLDDETIAELAERAMEQAESAPEGAIIGASDESGAGDSQLAGEGTQDLFGDDSRESLAGGEIERLDVPEETNPDGRRVRVEVAPEAELTETRMTPLGRMTWTRSSGTATQRQQLSTARRSLTARFHTPEQEY